MRALLVGIAVGVVLCFFTTLLPQWAGALPKDINLDLHTLTRFISNLDFFSVYAAVAAGVIGVFSLTTAKSSVLVGVLISVTTIPPPRTRRRRRLPRLVDRLGCDGGALVNLTSIFIAGFTTLYIQRRRRPPPPRPPSRPLAAATPACRSARAAASDKGYEPSGSLRPVRAGPRRRSDPPPPTPESRGRFRAEPDVHFGCGAKRAATFPPNRWKRRRA